MSTADKLNKLLETKQAIKQAIINKGVEVADDTVFAEYSTLINNIEDRYQEGYGNGYNDGYSNGYNDGSSNGGGDPYYEELLKAITNNNTDYSNLFNEYDGTIPDVSNWDTSNVTTMEKMFCLCGNIASLDLSSWNTGNVTTMYYMFYYCKQLTSLGDISNWNTGNVTSMAYMFANCESLTSLDLSGWDTSNAKSMGNIFHYCSSLESLNLSNWDMTKVTASYSMGNIFNGCKSLHTLRLDNCSYDTIKKLITSTGFPTNAIDGVTRTIYCKEENIGDLVAPTNWVFSFVTEEEPDIPLYNPGEFAYSSATEITTMVNESHTDLSSMFDWCDNLVSVNTQDWNTCNVTNTTMMFNNCHSLETLDLSNWDTGNLSNVMFMFDTCTNLKSIDVNNWDISNVTDMTAMFARCSSLTTINGISDWDTSNVTNMNGLFRECPSLESLDLSNWTIGEINVDSMFIDCTSLHTLRLDNCSYDTISKIVNSDGFPVSNAGNIYCKAENAANLTLPEGFNWTFSYID